METIPLILLQIIFGAVIMAAWITLPFMIIPGGTIIWAVFLVYVIVTGFNPASIAILVFQTIFMVITNTVDNLLMGGSAKAQGASWWSIGAAVLGALVGSVIFPPLGGIPGGFLFLFLAEYAQKKQLGTAWHSVKAMMKGFGWAAVTRMAAGSVMVFWFVALVTLQHLGWV
jgi:uncharacterized protein